MIVKKRWLALSGLVIATTGIVLGAVFQSRTLAGISILIGGALTLIQIPFVMLRFILRKGPWLMARIVRAGLRHNWAREPHLKCQRVLLPLGFGRGADMLARRAPFSSAATRARIRHEGYHRGHPRR